MKKLIEHYSEYKMLFSENENNLQEYRKFRFGRLKHEFWLKSRKNKDYVYIDEYDKFILDNLNPGKTCYFCSAGYYMEELIEDLTVVETRKVVKSFYPDAVIVKDREEFANRFETTFDNFVVVNNRSDHWTTLEGLYEHLSNYSKTLKNNGLLFYSFRDTQIQNIHRLMMDQEQLFLTFAKLLSRKQLYLEQHNIQFATKEKDPDGNYDFLENPDTTNGNIKFVFRKKV